MGYAGQVSLGHAGFLAIGGYASAAVSTANLLPLAASPVVAAARRGGPRDPRGRPVRRGGAAPLPLARPPRRARCSRRRPPSCSACPSLRLRGHYLAMATLSFGIIVHRVVARHPGPRRGRRHPRDPRAEHRRGARGDAAARPCACRTTTSPGRSSPWPPAAAQPRPLAGGPGLEGDPRRRGCRRGARRRHGPGQARGLRRERAVRLARGVDARALQRQHRSRRGVGDEIGALRRARGRGRHGQRGRRARGLDACSPSSRCAASSGSTTTRCSRRSSWRSCCSPRTGCSARSACRGRRGRRDASARSPS